MGERSYLLAVTEVRRETADACSVVFDVPDDARETFRFLPGQFLTVGIPSELTGLVARCYSLSVPPGEPLTVTVKRTDGGYASNWINDELRPGDRLRALPPAGIFTPSSLERDLLMWAGGSGITPVMSILRTVLAQGTGRVALFYANRERSSVIFADALAHLAAARPDRFEVFHWLEEEDGLPSRALLSEFAQPRIAAGYESFCCGPAPFMQAVQATLRALGVPRADRHQERFVSLTDNPFAEVV